jgi:hypothetical protein
MHRNHHNHNHTHFLKRPHQLNAHHLASLLLPLPTPCCTPTMKCAVLHRVHPPTWMQLDSKRHPLTLVSHAVPHMSTPIAAIGAPTQHTAIHTHSLTLIHSHSFIHTHSLTLIHSHSFIHTHSLTLIHSHSFTRTHSFTLIHSHTYFTHTHSLPLIHYNAHAHSHSFTHAHFTHTHAPTLILSFTHTHSLTLSLKPGQDFCFSLNTTQLTHIRTSFTHAQVPHYRRSCRPADSAAAPSSWLDATCATSPASPALPTPRVTIVARGTCGHFAPLNRTSKHSMHSTTSLSLSSPS